MVHHLLVILWATKRIGSRREGCSCSIKCIMHACGATRKCSFFGPKCHAHCAVCNYAYVVRDTIDGIALNNLLRICCETKRLWQRLTQLGRTGSTAHCYVAMPFAIMIRAWPHELHTSLMAFYVISLVLRNPFHAFNHFAVVNQYKKKNPKCSTL